MKSQYGGIGLQKGIESLLKSFQKRTHRVTPVQFLREYIFLKLLSFLPGGGGGGGRRLMQDFLYMSDVDSEKR